MRATLFIVLSLLGGPLAAAPSVATVRAHLIEHEGYRLTPYRDGPGYSVGIGHSLSANGERVKQRYTRAEVERLFLRDYAWALDSVRKGIRDFDDLPERAQLVALGVAWTTGRVGFERFIDFCRCLGYRAFDSAAIELRLSKWATQVSPKRVAAYVQILRSL